MSRSLVRSSVSRLSVPLPCCNPVRVSRVNERLRRKESRRDAPVAELRSPELSVPSWQQSWLDEYPCDMPSSVPYPRVPLSALLERAARRIPERPACTLYGRATTFAQLDEQARRLARALADLGRRPGRHVGRAAAEHPRVPDRPASHLADRRDGPAAQPAHGRRGGRPLAGGDRLSHRRHPRFAGPGRDRARWSAARWNTSS